MFSGGDREFFLRQAKTGDVVLFLGAGASHGSLNGEKRPIPKSGELTSILRAQTGVVDPNVTLGELTDEFVRLQGDQAFRRLLREHYSDCIPSDAISKLLRYTWFRLYTLNVDDVVERTNSTLRAQRIISVGRKERLQEHRDRRTLEVVHLNGFVHNPDQGFVFSPEQYRSEITRSSVWYQKCAEDFFNRIFLFVGTKLDEPIFLSHIEFLSKESGSSPTRSFFINPDQPSEFRIRKLADQNIVFLKGGLDDVVEFLTREIGAGLTPDDILGGGGRLSSIENSDSKVIESIDEIGAPVWLERNRPTTGQARRLGREFYSGFEPTWATIMAGVPADLRHDDQVFSAALGAIEDSGGLVVVRGQSGSGKSTSCMKTVRRLHEHNGVRAFQIREKTKERIRDVIRFVAAQDGDRKLLFIDNLVLFADDMADIERLARENRLTVLGQCRNRDWSDRIERRAPESAIFVDLPELADSDFKNLASGLNSHAVAPAFRKLGLESQIQFLKRSKRQLLVAMKEATGQRKFEQIIEDEYASIGDKTAEFIFCIVALATASKGHFTVGEVRRILEGSDYNGSISNAMLKLDGMVSYDDDLILRGRHEIFVRHALEFSADAQMVKDCIVSVLKYFVGFGQPVITRLGRSKGNIFKYVLGARFLFQYFSRRNNTIMAERVYSALELEYQQDGHYWLQRGLLYRKLQKQAVALDCLNRSVEAYPGNDFAKHALAQEKLIFAATSAPSPTVADMVTSAVEELEKQSETRDLLNNEYPIVTLSRFHPEVYVKWGDIERAKTLARDYFNRLEYLLRGVRDRDGYIHAASRQCLLLATQGYWESPIVDIEREG